MGTEAPGIDVVITWVDGADPAWLAEKARFQPATADPQLPFASEVRYRDWDNLHYVFRGIDAFMPWVRRVFLVTWGHLPAWIDTAAPRLTVVNHGDFIPSEYLPTFNSNAIELNFHRIPGLSEQFVLFNDDMFVIGPTQASDFFEGGLPRDSAILSPHVIRRDGIANIEVNNMEIINTYFSTDDVRAHRSKWFTPKYDKRMLRTAAFMRASCIFGIVAPHIPISCRKSTLEKLWELEGEVLGSTCSNRFRSKEDVNCWLIRQWQIMSGEFVPRATAFGAHCTMPKDLDRALAKLAHPGKTRLMCINDNPAVEDFEYVKQQVNAALQRLLPEKGSFEL